MSLNLSRLTLPLIGVISAFEKKTLPFINHKDIPLCVSSFAEPTITGLKPANEFKIILDEWLHLRFYFRYIDMEANLT
jgi:hypothetical protein